MRPPRKNPLHFFDIFPAEFLFEVKKGFFCSGRVSAKSETGGVARSGTADMLRKRSVNRVKSVIITGMKSAILVHGWAHKDEFYDLKYPTPSNSHWFPWLTKQLMSKDIYTVAVEMPNSFYPQYEVWKKEFERFDISEDTILVGHSCGGGFLVRWLSENNAKVGKVILVAPWMGIRPDQEFDDTFFDFVIDQNLADKTKSLTIFNSSNDVSEIQDSVKLLREKLNDVQLVELENKGHFTLKGLGTEEFPELLDELLRD